MDTTRLAAYGITGAFFWLLQLVTLLSLLAFSGHQPSGTVTLLLRSLDTLAVPQGFQPLVNSLLTVLGTLLVFFTGLVLDLIGAYFVIWDMASFHRHIRAHRDWLDGLLMRQKPPVREDYHELMSRFVPPFSMERARALGGLLRFWRLEAWRRVFKISNDRFRLIRRYGRLQSFLLTYVDTFSGGSKLALLGDGIHIWRISRAIATAIMVVYFELCTAPFLGLLNGFSPNERWFVASMLVCINTAAFGFAALIAHRSYDRVCDMLFSAAYVTSASIERGADQAASVTADV